MAGLQISCPKCGKTLKLPDRSLLGRKGKCPKCKHQFVMTAPPDAATEEADTESLDVDELYDELHQIEQRRLAGEPDEVQFEIAEPTRGPATAGTGARWIPDAPQVAEVPPAAPAMPPSYPYPMPPQMPMPPQPWPVPPGYAPVMYPPQPGMPYPVMPGYAPMPYTAQPYAPNPMMAPAAPPAVPMFAPPVPASAPAPANDNPFAAFSEPEPSPSALPTEAEMLSDQTRTSKTKAKSKKSRKAKQSQLMAIIAVGLLVVAGIAFMTLGGRAGGNGKAKNKAVAQNNEDAAEDGDDAQPPQWESPLPVSPTKGDPINMVCMPYGVSAIVHLRPADLWEKNPKREEFRFCWGPLGEWLEKEIKAVTNHEPTDIEELTFGFIPGVVSEPMQLSGVVRLKQAAQKTELIKSFREMKAELKESEGDYPVYESDQYAYVIKDLQTFAFCPRAKQSEMVEAINRPNAQGPGLEALIKKTDRQRQIVLLFDPTTLAAHGQFILPAELHPVLNRALEFFEPKQIETVAWSLHVTDEKFHSEILARNRSSVAKTTLQTDLSKRLDQLPKNLMDMIRGYMDPKTLGPREIIGRFPAMTKVYAMTTHATSGDRYAALTTSLPRIAAPNLAIGALLTWDESTRTDFSKAAGPATLPKDTGTKLPDLVADRLKQLKLEIEFTKVPLQDGIKYIADECKVTIDIDGDALKAAGFTKNMEQNMKLGKVTGLEAIAAILKKYEKEKVPMVLVVDEGKKQALVTTKDFAEKDNLKTFPLP